MLASHNKIERHKADIEKRISELQNKLKQPIRSSQVGLHERFIDHEVPQHRAYIQNQQYIQPKQVTALRERELNLKQSRPKYNKNIEEKPAQMIDKKHDNDNYLQNSNRKQKRMRDSQQNGFSRTQQFHNIRKQPILSYSNQKGDPKGQDIYNLMTQILNNQKNLQKQISCLRSQWSREQSLRTNKENSYKNDTPYMKIKQQQPKSNQVISFQEPQPTLKPEVFEIRNKQSDKNNNYMKQNKRLNENKYKNQKHHQADTFGMYNEEGQQKNQQIEVKILKSSQRPRNSCSISKNRAAIKKVQQAQAQEKLLNLIKNQKCRNQRHIVNDQQKNEFWKLVEKRIRESQKEYRETVHRNNKYEHQHLINTNQLQKKLREEVISKVYGQCNNCIYK